MKFIEEKLGNIVNLTMGQSPKSEYYNFGKDLDLDPGYKRFLDRKDLEKRNILKDNLIEEFLSY